MSEFALEVNSLNAKIGNFALKDITLKGKKGTITGLIGRNGAGKTTFIKTILNIIQKTSGQVLFFDKEFSEGEVEIKQNIGVVFDTLIYGVNMTPIGIMKMISPFYPAFNKEKFFDLLLRFSLNPKAKLRTYSKGMQMMFSIVMALSHNPDLIILDEPTAGLDPIARAFLIDILFDIIQNEEKSILFSTHITSDLDKIADYITMIDNGKIIFTEEKDKMLDKYALVHIEKSAMSSNIAPLLTGLKETAFGFEGLCYDKAKLSGIDGILTTRPTIEDIMIFRGGF